MSQNPWKAEGKAVTHATSVAPLESLSATDFDWDKNVAVARDNVWRKTLMILAVV